MNQVRSKGFRLDICLDFARSLVDGADFHELQPLLREFAPRWSAGLHVWRYRQEKTLVDINHPGALAAGVLERATERGPLYYRRQREQGTDVPERIFGSAELRGADRSLILVPIIDSQVFCQNG